MGRIVFDSESSAQDAKLNDASIVLESSRQMGSGVRIPLKFAPNLVLRGASKETKDYGVFPGAMIACRGRNGGGGWFLVKEILAV